MNKTLKKLGYTPASLTVTVIALVVLIVWMTIYYTMGAADAH